MYLDGHELGSRTFSCRGDLLYHKGALGMLRSCRQINHESKGFTGDFTTLRITHVDPVNAYDFGFDSPNWIGNIWEYLHKKGRSFNQVRELHLPYALPSWCNLDVQDGREELPDIFPALERLVFSEEHIPQIDDKGMGLTESQRWIMGKTGKAIGLEKSRRMTAVRLLFKKPRLKITRQYTGCQVLEYFHTEGVHYPRSPARLRYHWKEKGCACTTQKCTDEILH